MRRNDDDCAKANEIAGAIVVSFHSSWQQKIRRSAFSVVLRKRIPTATHPQRMYLHVNSPIGAICARAQIKEMRNISREDALKLGDEINLSAENIINYVGNHALIGAYFLSSIEYAPCEAKYKEIQSKISYFPPQSYLSLSPQAENIISIICGYRAIVI